MATRSARQEPAVPLASGAEDLRAERGVVAADHEVGAAVLVHVAGADGGDCITGVKRTVTAVNIPFALPRYTRRCFAVSSVN